MILFYAWTNTVLMNVVNTKIHFFAEEDADLLIRSNPTLSKELISEIESLGIFQKIYYVDIPKISKTGGRFGKIPKIRLFSLKNRFCKFYSRYISENLLEKVYSKFITGGLWNDSLYIIRELHLRNPQIEVEFVEEGERSYEGMEALCIPIPAGTWKEKLIAYYSVGFYKWKYKTNIKNCLYLYRPDRYEESSNICLYKLPEINYEDNRQCFKILDNVSSAIESSILYRYNKREIFYIANYLVPKYEASYDIAHGVIDIAIKVFGNSNVIIKPHTNATEHRCNFAKQYESKVFVDRNVFLFESLYTKIDISNKILIAKNSTALLYPKQLFDKEPYIIFTYRLFPYYHEYGDNITDAFIMDMKKLYKNSDKIIVPNTMMELESQLRKIYNTLFETKYKIGYSDKEE